MEKTTIKRTGSIALEHLINSIESQEQINNNVLTGIIREAKLKEVDFLGFNQFNHNITESYGRNKLYEGANFSIFLMSWAPGDFTAIHSHGYCAWGAVYFFGNTNHRLYNAVGNSVVLAEKGVVPGGTIAPVTGNLVHAMGNLSGIPVMSLHIYGSEKDISNANDDSTVYELEKKLIRITDGSAFINMSAASAKKTNTGVVTNKETISDYFNILLPYYRKNGNDTMAKYLETVIQNPELYFL